MWSTLILLHRRIGRQRPYGEPILQDSTHQDSTCQAGQADQTGIENRETQPLPSCFYWRTCLREIQIGDSRLLAPDLLSPEERHFKTNHTIDRVHGSHGSSASDNLQGAERHHGDSWELWSGYHAYRFLLELLLGLHSEIIGENEILGQFCRAFRREALPPGPLGAYLQRLQEEIRSDARQLRREEMQGLGERSYGGLARQLLKNCQNVYLIGSGYLGARLIPWLKQEGRTISLIGRRPERLAQLERRYGIAVILEEEINRLQVDLKIDAKTGILRRRPGDALIVAAPILSLKPYAPLFNMEKREPGRRGAGNREGAALILLDFRSRERPKEQPFRQANCYSLADLFALAKRSRIKREKLLSRIRPSLDALVEKRRLQGRQMIFGWEDIEFTLPSISALFNSAATAPPFHPASGS